MKLALGLTAAACGLGLVALFAGQGAAHRGEQAEGAGRYSLRAHAEQASAPAAAPAARYAQRVPASPASRSQNGEPVAPSCLVTLIEERNIPAEEAGVLTKMAVREGVAVQAFIRPSPRLKPHLLADKSAPAEDAQVRPLAEIDKSLPLLQRQVAEKEYIKADADARNMVSILYAQKSRDVAQKAYQMALEANRRSPGSIPQLEIDKLKLEWEASQLKVEQSQHEQKQAILTTHVKEAELANAEQAMEHRDIHSPIDGVVAQIYVKEGEWVKPGDPVFRVIKLDKLRVQGTLNIADTLPGDVAGKSVTVTLTIEGQEVALPGQIVFVQREIKTGGRYTVWAEVENRKSASGDFVLLPGMQTSMTVHTRAASTAQR